MSDIGVGLIAECIERGLNTIGKDETQMTVTRQDVEDLREVLEEIERLKDHHAHMHSYCSGRPDTCPQMPEVERLKGDKMCIAEMNAKLREENERLKEPTCQFAGPGRGDCEHFVGYSPILPTDDYGKPEEWCWWCWRAKELEQLKANVGFQRDAADKFVKDRKEAEAKIEAALALHTEWEIYDECGCDHTGEDLVAGKCIDVPEVGLTCEEGRMQSVCRHCHLVNDEPTEATEDGEFPCPTVKALRGEEGK